MRNLEKHFGSWAIPNLTIWLLIFQAVGVALIVGTNYTESDLVLSGNLVQSGQWWRLFSFMSLPESTDPLWLVFSFYIFYLMGGCLEKEWGAFRYNLFVLSGYSLTLVAAFVDPTAEITSTYFLGCVLLAFATLFPFFELRLFFLFSVQVRWLGWIAAVGYAIAVIGGWPGRTAAAAALMNYFLYFGIDIIKLAKARERRRAFVAKHSAAAAQPLHVCSKCGASDKSDQALHFRYCSTCGDCFCEEHIGNHGHE